MTATEKLVQRMLSFNGNFDGYPSMWCSDENLVWEAIIESNAKTPPENLNDGTSGDGVVLMSYLASVHAQNKTQYENAKRFILAFVEAAWDCNMTEGSNPAHEEVQEGSNAVAT